MEQAAILMNLSQLSRAVKQHDRNECRKEGNIQESLCSHQTPEQISQEQNYNVDENTSIWPSFSLLITSKY